MKMIIKMPSLNRDIMIKYYGLCGMFPMKIKALATEYDMSVYDVRYKINSALKSIKRELVKGGFNL